MSPLSLLPRSGYGPYRLRRMMMGGVSGLQYRIASGENDLAAGFLKLFKPSFQTSEIQDFLSCFEYQEGLPNKRSKNLFIVS